MRDRGKHEIIWSALFSAALSFCITAGRRAVFGDSVKLGNDANYFEPFAWYDPLLFLLIAALIFAIVMLIAEARRRFPVYYDTDVRERGKGSRNVFWVSCALIFLAWLPYLMALAPGSVVEDSFDSIAQLTEASASLDNHHPVAYTLTVGAFLKAGLILGDINIGVFLYSLAQTAVMIATVSYVFVIMYRKGAPVWTMAPALLWYMFMPIFPDYAMIMWKDPIFSCALLWLSFLLLELAGEREKAGDKKWLARYAFTCLVILFFRNNGIYIVVLASAVLILLCRSMMKRFLITSALILAFYCTVTGPVYGALGIKGEFVESVGIPLQQMASVIASDGDLTEEDKEFLYRLLPEQEWKSNYTPCIVDTLKWHEEFDQEYLEANKGRFIKVWFSGLVRNFPEYVKAYGMETLGFWKIGVQNDYGYIAVYISENGYGIHETDLFERIFHSDLGGRIRDFRIYIGSGTLLWITLAAALFTVIDRKRYWLALIPALGNWLTTMVATPVAFSLRYVYIFALGLPLFLILPFISRVQRRGGKVCPEP